MQVSRIFTTRHSRCPTSAPIEDITPKTVLLTETDVNETHEKDDETISRSTQTGSSLRYTGWRFGVLLACITAGTVCLLNSILAIWLAVARPAIEGNSSMYIDKCTSVDQVASGIHILINILGTLLLAASNYTMQCLVAPTRSDCDRAHAKGSWLHIGVNTIRNLPRIKRWRAILWLLLALSSIPIHLLYNSSIYKVLAANEYKVVVVNEAFLHNSTEPIWMTTEIFVTYYDDKLEPSVAEDYGESSSSECFFDNGVIRQSIWNDTVQGNLEHLIAQECHFSDCSIDSALNISSPSQSSLSVSSIMNTCFGNADCAVKTSSNGSVSLDLRDNGNSSTLDIWTACHLSDCRISLGDQDYDGDRAINVLNPTLNDTLHNCWLSGSSQSSHVPTLSVASLNRSQISAWRDTYLRDSTKYTKMSTTACLETYGNDLITQFNNVFMVNNDTSSQPKAFAQIDSQEYYETLRSSPTSTPYTWICDKDYGSCDVEAAAQNVSYTLGGERIDYCMVEQREALCSIQYSLAILMAVIICNAIKAGCMFLTIWWCRDSPLLVIGDAIASYLDRADTQTDQEQSQQPVLSAEGVDHQGQATRTTRKLLQSPAILFRGAGPWQILLCFLLATIFMSAAVKLLMMATSTISDYYSGSPWSLGLGTTNPHLTIAQPDATLSLLTAVLIANMPQLLLSVVYVLYNALLSTMLLYREWTSYGVRHRALRVSTPSGMQRSTYFLQLPYKYGIPLLAASATLHWLVSQSLFLVRIDFFQDGVKDIGGDITTLGYSALPILLALVLGAVMLLAVIVVGMTKSQSIMPLKASNSRTIAAACHPEHDPDAAQLKVRWGEVAETINDDVGYCTFSSEPVESPLPGRYYR